MKIEALRPLKINRPDGDPLHLRPGCPVDVPDELGARILERVPDGVRIAESTCIEPTVQNPRPIYWESATGQILAAVPELLAKSGDQYWIVTTVGQQVRWVNADQLRSRKQFERQKPLMEVALIKEVF